ncbi:hypothetical protein FPOAC2_11842 [Fusarium poae]|uniref:Uncharacterized protein n=1 Tax=Fusarium poae TaxID=36050 RepID=A0A1B8AER7_FUSPO|nr:hypothetical protein FPOAC1_011535 [Fusarium poae]KAG8666721.1 hypothetical protein FPOAC1_011535 [Fusarium poae]OBS18973.1 hypothetical protein FPOA_10698 [Fusarium poae]
MSSTTDRLTALPSLVLTEIFVQLETEHSIRGLIRAHPSMIWLYHRYERGILERILTNLLADDVEGLIRKDALAIMEFNTAEGHSYSQYRGRDFEIQHFQWPEWADSPTLGDLRQLHRLLSRVIIFVEDYISKATSDYPPRAYLGLPDLLTGKPSFMGSLLDTRMVAFTNLTRPERYRLLRHFVKYEFLCNLYKTRKNRDNFRHQFHGFIAFGTPHAPDPKLLLSVHEYYASLYGAVSAHCTDAWLPSVPSSLTLEGVMNLSASDCRPLVYPDNLFFDHNEYMSDLGYRDLGLAEELAGLGLDLLTSVLSRLRMDKGKGKTYVKFWLQKLHNPSLEFDPWIRRHYVVRYDEEAFAYTELLIPARVSCPALFPPEPLASCLPALNNQLLLGSDIDETYGAWVIHESQVLMYRQRAWGFFDDQRLYSNTVSHFPDLFELYMAISPLVDVFIRLDAKFGGDVGLQHEHRQLREQRRRRSQLWQDYWARRRADEPFLDDDERYDNMKEFRFFTGGPAPQQLPTTWTAYDD